MTCQLHQSYTRATSTTVWNKFFGWELITVIHISGVSWIWSAWGQHPEGGLATSVKVHVCTGTCTCNTSNVLTFYGSMILLLKAPRNLGKVRWCSKNVHLPKLRSELKILIIWSRKQYSQDKSLRGNSLQTTPRAHGTLVYRDADTGVFCERSIRIKSSKLTIPSPSSSMPGKIQ